MKPIPRVLADADLVLEFFVNRSRYINSIESLMHLMQCGYIQVYVTEQCLDKIRFYLGKPDIQLGEQAVLMIEEMFKSGIIPISSKLIDQSRTSPLNDFESAVEVTCATVMGLDAIITHNPQNFWEASIPVWTAEQLLQDKIPSSMLVQQILTEYQAELPPLSISVWAVVERIAIEVERICSKSDRIQNSGDIQVWRMTLARLRMQKCLNYYRLGSRQGRVELMSHLSTMVYRHIAPHQAQLGFSARYNAIEDFLQGFNVEVLKAFRRENDLGTEYCPKTRLELAEYMAFTEQYAKRRITLPGQRSQQLIVLRAQGYAQRQSPEGEMDRHSVMDQIREQMVAEAIDPTDSIVRNWMSIDPANSVIRDWVIAELIEYLEEQGQSDCVEYLVLKLKDLSAPEIDDLLGLSPRQRDRLQQRFKYHVEKFACLHGWQLAPRWLQANLKLGMSSSQWEAFLNQLSPEQHQLLEAMSKQLDVSQNLGMSASQWEAFLSQLTPDQQHLLQLKSKQIEDQEIAKLLKCTTTQVQKRWARILEIAKWFRDAA